MLTKEENELLTRVSPGTPVGEVFRRYWHPICTSSEIRGKRAIRLRILGENLVLFKNNKERLGLVADGCPHRGVSLSYGFPEEDGLRCAYHGWKFGFDGKCLEQPFEPKGSKYKDNIRISAYKVKEYRGFVWAYMGPEPAPLLPNWNFLSRDDGVRFIISYESNYNWLQAMENSMDSTHTYFLHGKMLKEKMPKIWQETYGEILDYYDRPIEKFQFIPFEYGFRRSRTWGGTTPNKESGYPPPAIVLIGTAIRPSI